MGKLITKMGGAFVAFSLVLLAMFAWSPSGVAFADEEREVTVFTYVVENGEQVPLPNVDVELYSLNGYAEVTTDENGLATVSVPYCDPTYNVNAWTAAMNRNDPIPGYSMPGGSVEFTLTDSGAYVEMEFMREFQYDWAAVVNAAANAVGSSDFSDPYDFVNWAFEQGGDSLGVTPDNIESLGVIGGEGQGANGGPTGATINDYVMRASYGSITDVVFSQDKSRVGIFIGCNLIVEYADGVVRYSSWPDCKDDFPLRMTPCGDPYGKDTQATFTGDLWTAPTFIFEGDVPEELGNALTFDVEYASDKTLCGIYSRVGVRANLDGEIDPDGSLSSVRYLTVDEVKPIGGTLDVPVETDFTGVAGTDPGVNFMMAGFIGEDSGIILSPRVPEGYVVSFECDYDDTVVRDDGTLFINGRQGEYGKGFTGNIIIRFSKYEEPEIPVVEFSSVKYGVPTETVLEASDESELVIPEEAEALDGVSFRVEDAEGIVLTTFETSSEESVDVSFESDLDTFYIIEEEAPEGYELMDPVEVSILDDGSFSYSPDGETEVIAPATDSGLPEIDLINFAVPEEPEQPAQPEKPEVPTTYMPVVAPPKETIPETGDGVPIQALIVLVSAAAVSLVAIRRSRA